MGGKAQPELPERFLPSVESLLPVDPESTFGECGYTSGQFKDLPDYLQLTIANDIVRQALSINYFPARYDEANLSGDCVTSAKIYAAYAVKLGIPGEFMLASVKRNPFDFAGRESTRHVVVLRDDPSTGFQQTIDPAVMVGYGYGTVGSPGRHDNGRLVSVGNDPLIYEDICVLDEEDLAVITLISEARNLHYTRDSLTPARGKRILWQVGEVANSRQHLNSWVSELHYILALLSLKEGRIEGFKNHIRTSVQLDPLKPKVFEIAEAPPDVLDVVRKTFRLYQEVAQAKSVEWLMHAQELLAADDPVSYPEAIRLLQWAFRELKAARLTADETPGLIVGGRYIPLYNINPRMMYEAGLTTVWVKPSAFLLGIQDLATKHVLSTTDEVVWSRGLDISNADRYGYRALFAAHPHGVANLRGYSGPSLVLVVRGDREAIRRRKQDLRGELGDYPGGTRVRWFDGGLIDWNPWTMNHIHSADSAAESVIDLMMLYPELSLITRWSYPHPFL